MTSFCEMHARELLRVGDTWHLSRVEALDEDSRAPDARIRVTGWEAPLLPDGCVSWRRKVKGTCRVVIFTHAQHRAFLLAWEQRTGKCYQCAPDNPGMEWIGWDLLDGNSFQVCTRCGGTNTAPHLLAQAAA